MLALGFGVMLLAALGFLAAVLFTRDMRSLKDTDIAQSGRQSNIDSFRDRQVELDQQLTRGELDNVQHQQLLLEAQRSLLDDVAEVSVGKTSSRGIALLIGSAVFVAVLAPGLYQYLGAAADLDIRHLLENNSSGNNSPDKNSPDKNSPEKNSPEVNKPEQESGKHTEALAEKIRLRLKRQPDNYYYRVLLARAYQEQNKLILSQQQYAEAVRLSPDDLVVRAEYAQVLFLAAESVVTEEVVVQVEKILREEANNASALGLRGIAAFSAGSYRAALADWSRALKFLPPNSEAARAMRSGIEVAREQIASAGGEPVPAEQADEQSGKGIRVSLSLAEDLIAAPDTLLFVYIQEWNGPPMPMMAQRLTVADLPLDIEFRNDQALMPGRDFSSVPVFEVVARISHSGTPTANSGDFEGRYGPVELSAESGGQDAPVFSLNINRLLP